MANFFWSLLKPRKEKEKSVETGVVITDHSIPSALYPVLAKVTTIQHVCSRLPSGPTDRPPYCWTAVSTVNSLGKDLFLHFDETPNQQVPFGMEWDKYYLLTLTNQVYMLPGLGYHHVTAVAAIPDTFRVNVCKVCGEDLIPFPNMSLSGLCMRGHNSTHLIMSHQLPTGAFRIRTELRGLEGTHIPMEFTVSEDLGNGYRTLHHYPGFKPVGTFRFRHLVHGECVILEDSEGNQRSIYHYINMLSHPSSP